MEEDNNLQHDMEIKGVAEKVLNEPSEDSEQLSEGSEQESEVSEERFGHQTKSRVRTQDHTLSVREVAKIFEEKGLDVTERTVLNWCHPNKKDGSYRLDCYFDPLEKKYYVTPQSAQTIIPKHSVGAVAQEKSPIQRQQYSESSEPIAEPPEEFWEDIPKDSSELVEEFPKAARHYIRQLELKQHTLEGEKQAQEHIIKKYEDMQDKVYDFVAGQGREIGQLQQKLALLEGSKNRDPQQSSEVEAVTVLETHRSSESSPNVD